MVFLRGASNDPTLHICGVCFGLNVAHGTNNIILINISTAHTPWPSLTSNHIHIYTNCMNTKVKFFYFVWIYGALIFVCALSTFLIWLGCFECFFFACCFMCLHRKIHIWGTKIFHKHFDAIGLFNVFSQQVAAFFSISLVIYEFSHSYEKCYWSQLITLLKLNCVSTHIYVYTVHTHPTNTQKYQPGKLPNSVNLSLH